MPNFFIEVRLFCVSSPFALGIGAASFASFFGQQTTDNRQQIFLSEEKTNASKDIAESPTACRNARKEDYKTTRQQGYKFF